jgi:glycosyltransferase involved in cell wall biosynthesis
MVDRGEEPAVSVIVPARDAAPTLDRTLRTLGAQRIGEPFEVILIDDGSHDETVSIARRHAPLVKIIQNEVGLGPGAARNVGVAVARAAVLAFTDADCFPAPDWLSHALEAIETADLVQGRVEPDPDTPRTPFDRSLSVNRDRSLYQTANLVVRREVFDAVGGFRDWSLEQPGRRRWSVDHRRSRATRTPIGEDTLFAWAARRLGFRSAYAPDALVHHAVVRGDMRDAAADRWHWTRDMPGLARLVPELRETTFYGRWFFADWTAQFDLAVAGLVTALLTRRCVPLVAAAPYLRRLVRDARVYGGASGSRSTGVHEAASFMVGEPLVDAVTLAGFVSGSISWRSVVL